MENAAEKTRIYSLDGLKVFFSLLIFFHHYWGGITNYGESGMAPFERILRPIYFNGALGVEFFLLLSGYMICYNYKGIIRNIAVVSFLKKRLRKLYFLTVCSVTFGFFLSVVNAKYGFGINLVEKPISYAHLVWSILLINNGWFFDSFNAYGSGTWFLNVLFLCYFVWAIITKLFYKKGREAYYSALIMTIIGMVCVYKKFNIPFLFQVSGRGYMNFFFGVLLAETLGEKNRAYTVQTILLALFGIVFGIRIHNVSAFFVTFLLAPISVLLAIYFRPLKVFLETKLLKVLSRYTMAFYLSHVFVITIFVMADAKYNIGFEFNQMGTMMLVLATSCAVAALLDYVDNGCRRILTKKNSENCYSK